MKTQLFQLLARKHTQGRKKVKCWLDCVATAKMVREWKMPQKSNQVLLASRHATNWRWKKYKIRSSLNKTEFIRPSRIYSSTSKRCCFLWATTVFNNSVTEPSFQHKHATLHSSIRKTKKIWRLKWDIICERNLPRVVLLIRERNCRASAKASDMSKRKGRSLRKMGRKMFSKHHRPSSIVYTWKDIDFFVTIWPIIRHLVRRGIFEALLSSELVSNTLPGSRGCTHVSKGVLLRVNS